MSLRAFLNRLRNAGELVVVDAPVDPHLEIAEVHRRVIAAGGPALMFRSVKGSSLSLATNLFGTARRVEMAFGPRPEQLVQQIAALPHELMPPSLSAIWDQRKLFRDLSRIGLSRGRASDGILRTGPAMDEVPALQTWHEDGGPFYTLPLVYTEHPHGPAAGAPNLGMYRMQRYDAATTGMHWQIGKGGGFHYAVAESLGQPLPVNVTLGGPPELILAAIAPLPENVPELMLASLVAGEKLRIVQGSDSPLPMFADAEVTLVGRVAPHQRRPEGPFGDHYGYYSLQHDYPVFECKAIHRRKDAIVAATVVGKPRQEDFFIGDYLQELLSPVFPLVMPQVIDLWSYGETGYHSLAAAVVRQRYKREAMASAFRILGEGQLSLTKFLLVLDEPRDIHDFPATLEHVLERADFRTDLYVFGNLSMDTLDYSGPKVNEGSKGVLLGVGEPRRSLPGALNGELPGWVKRAEVFCRGCLVVEIEPGLPPEELAKLDALRDWPLIVIADDARQATRSATNFLWITFTRFEPAADIYAADVDLLRLHPSFTPPVVVDARLKPGFPDELFCDEDTAATVEQRWSEYFPDGNVEMGDSDRAHLD